MLAGPGQTAGEGVENGGKWKPCGAGGRKTNSKYDSKKDMKDEDKLGLL